MNRQWLKVTFDATIPGIAKVSNYPKRGHTVHAGRWIVFDKNVSTKAISDHETFEDAAKACNSVPGVTQQG